MRRQFPSFTGSARLTVVEPCETFSNNLFPTVTSPSTKRCRPATASFMTTPHGFMNALKDKRSIITGAGGAIGRATAVRFAREGASVGLIDIDSAALSATAERVRGTGGRAVEVSCDVRREADVVQAVTSVVSAFG